MKILSTFLMKNLRKLHLTADTYSSALMCAQTLCSIPQMGVRLTRGLPGPCRLVGKTGRQCCGGARVRSTALGGEVLTQLGGFHVRFSVETTSRTT